jgi:hypothetical protein
VEYGKEEGVMTKEQKEFADYIVRETAIYLLKEEYREKIKQIDDLIRAVATVAEHNSSNAEEFLIGWEELSTAWEAFDEEHYQSIRRRG